MLGVTPTVIRRKDLTADRLAAAIEAGISDPRYRRRAEAAAVRLHGEDGIAPVLAAVDAALR